MEREKLKKIFEKLDEEFITMMDILDLFENICDPSFAGDNLDYLYIFVKLVKEKFEQLDRLRGKAQFACLD